MEPIASAADAIPTFEQIARIAPMTVVILGIVGVSVWGTLRVLRFAKEYLDRK